MYYFFIFFLCLSLSAGASEKSLLSDSFSSILSRYKLHLYEKCLAEFSFLELTRDISKYLYENQTSPADKELVFKEIGLWVHALDLHVQKNIDTQSSLYKPMQELISHMRAVLTKEYSTYDSDWVLSQNEQVPFNFAAVSTLKLYDNTLCLALSLQYIISILWFDKEKIKSFDQFFQTFDISQPILPELIPKGIQNKQDNVGSHYAYHFLRSCLHHKEHTSAPEHKIAFSKIGILQKVIDELKKCQGYCQCCNDHSKSSRQKQNCILQQLDYMKLILDAKTAFFNTQNDGIYVSELTQLNITTDEINQMKILLENLDKEKLTQDDKDFHKTVSQAVHAYDSLIGYCPKNWLACTDTSKEGLQTHIKKLQKKVWLFENLQKMVSCPILNKYLTIHICQLHFMCFYHYVNYWLKGFTKDSYKEILNKLDLLMKQMRANDALGSHEHFANLFVQYNDLFLAKKLNNNDLLTKDLKLTSSVDLLKQINLSIQEIQKIEADRREMVTQYYEYCNMQDTLKSYKEQGEDFFSSFKERDAYIYSQIARHMALAYFATAEFEKSIEWVFLSLLSNKRNYHSWQLLFDCIEHKDLYLNKFTLAQLHDLIKAVKQTLVSKKLDSCLGALYCIAKIQGAGCAKLDFEDKEKFLKESLLKTEQELVEKLQGDLPDHTYLAYEYDKLKDTIFDVYKQIIINQLGKIQNIGVHNLCSSQKTEIIKRTRECFKNICQEIEKTKKIPNMFFNYSVLHDEMSILFYLADIEEKFIQENMKLEKRLIGLTEIKQKIEKDADLKKMYRDILCRHIEHRQLQRKIYKITQNFPQKDKDTVGRLKILKRDLENFAHWISQPQDVTKQYIACQYGILRLDQLISFIITNQQLVSFMLGYMLCQTTQKKEELADAYAELETSLSITDTVTIGKEKKTYNVMELKKQICSKIISLLLEQLITKDKTQDQKKEIVGDLNFYAQIINQQEKIDLVELCHKLVYPAPEQITQIPALCMDLLTTNNISNKIKENYISYAGNHLTEHKQELLQVKSIAAMLNFKNDQKKYEEEIAQVSKDQLDLLHTFLKQKFAIIKDETLKSNTMQVQDIIKKNIQKCNQPKPKVVIQKAESVTNKTDAEINKLQPVLQGKKNKKKTGRKKITNAPKNKNAKKDTGFIIREPIKLSGILCANQVVKKYAAIPNGQITLDMSCIPPIIENQLQSAKVHEAYTLLMMMHASAKNNMHTMFTTLSRLLINKKCEPTIRLQLFQKIADNNSWQKEIEKSSLETFLKDAAHIFAFEASMQKRTQGDLMTQFNSKNLQGLLLNTMVQKKENPDYRAMLGGIKQPKLIYFKALEKK